MTKYKLEYLWLDGYTPVPNLRGKTQIKDFSEFPKLEELPLWRIRRELDPAGRGEQFGLRAEAGQRFPGQHPKERRDRDVRSHDARRQGPRIRRTSAPPSSTTKGPGSGSSRNISSTRTAGLSASPDAGYPAPQGPYYTGVGYSNVGDVARKIVDEHLDLCLDAGINHEGINAEVAKGQWEFQIFGKGSKKAADEMWVARYLMQRLTEKYGIDIEYHCKPLGDTDWNGSGMHAKLLDQVYAREGRQRVFRKADGGFQAEPRGPYRGVRPR